ncbi:hypothetical protein SAMN04488498_1426 [Mesorhizobium albiziae]|uniref:Radical SAM protein n=2 Tax=Neomesorhizobium albiziae TaxID=335020 RepID=A0A1I4FF15_9HYPH|nr:hypothetical protein GCM10007937_25640 [Mesorhizobium albiziae]SFL15507.1 hypothetical protein SAMN04488498_1426 [Mesorhizobium albiziae]
MSVQSKRLTRFGIALENRHNLRIEEVFRLGALRDGVQLLTTEIRFPILGQVIPRIEIELFGEVFRKKITARMNSESPFMFDGEALIATINGVTEQIPCRQVIDPDRAPAGMYNFGITRKNGARSFVFDYHTYCCYSCDFCFKENEWEVMAIQGGGSTDYRSNFQECLSYIERNGHNFNTLYDIVWLCTGSIKDDVTELERHAAIARRLREAGYAHDIYLSQVVPPSIRNDRVRRIEYLIQLREAGVTRFNTGVEIVDADLRRKYIRGFKGTYIFGDYLPIFADAVDVFGPFHAGSCLLTGIEPSDNTIEGLKALAELSVAPAPTVLTPFVTKQLAIPFCLDLDELLDAHARFNVLIERHKLPVFSGVFSLA